MFPLEITPQEASAKLAAGGADLVLLDCREMEELKLARLTGALHIPMGDIPGRLPTLDPEREYIVFCHHGVRSLHVVHFLRQQDFARVRSMRGGIDAWSQLVDPSVSRY